MKTTATENQDCFDRAKTHDKLARRYWESFEKSGERGELEKCIAHRRTALEFCPDGRPNRAESLCNLACSLSARYLRWSQLEDLEESIKLNRAALELRPEGHPYRPKSLSDLANSLTDRYELQGRTKDLEEAIELDRAALELIPEGHPNRSVYLCNLGASLGILYERQGSTGDLEKVIELDRAALELRPRGHPERSISLGNLAASLTNRFQRQGRTKDLEEAIESYRAALDLRPKGHLDRSVSLNNLASALRTRYEWHGRMEDFEEAVAMHRASLELRPEGHPDRFASLDSLAISLKARYSQQGDPKDLEEAIGLHRATIELHPEDHLHRSKSLVTLANSLKTRYKLQGRTKDLEEAVELHRAALDLRPEGHSHRSVSLGGLASCLRTWYEQQGSSKDLEEAIELDRAALELRPEGHLDRPNSLSNLAASLRIRYKQQGMTKDLDEAIELDRAALELRPEGRPDRSESLHNLAISLKTRCKQPRRTEDLEEAIELDRAALELRPVCHPSRYFSLSSLATTLTTRYEQQGRIKDLEEATELERAALELLPEGHSHRSTALRNLAESLYARIMRQWHTEEFEECMHLLELAATHEFSSLLVRLPDAQRWAALARLHNHHTACSAYQTAVSILQYALAMRPTLREQHDFLIETNGYGILALEAASYAIERTELERAVEILEQGRGLLWSQLRGLRTPLDQLADTNKELADRFRDVNRRLENLATSHEEFMSGSTMDGDDSVRSDSKPGQKLFDELFRLKKQLSREQEGIINEVRQVAGFESFLKAIPFKDLQQAASEGPIIMVNHSEYRSDVLIIFFRDLYPVVCVPLDKDFYGDSIKLCNELVDTRQRLKSHPLEYEKKLCEAMKMIWERVVSKVVGKLTENGVTKGSRIWWCPTSVLSALPFHAAGPFKDSEGPTKYLLDDYISSYTPTLGALINARSNSGTSDPKLLVVGDTATLRSTQQEIRNIRNCMSSNRPGATVLTDRRASRRTVMKMLRKVTWVHFACHGHLDVKPFDSSFKLADRGLTLLDIIRANVPNAEFAFLSACHTAELSHLGVHDEALHLSAAMQFSGFRSVIGTMWELYDEDGPLFARAVYEYMNECKEGELMYKRAAGGLREAAIELRGREGIPTERWVNFVHIGA